MKKIAKILIALALIGVMSLSLTGCIQIDKMRKNHAVWIDDEQTTIMYQGKTYKVISGHNETDYFYNKFYTSDDEPDFIYITDSDVPVLLSVFVGLDAMITEDKSLIMLSNYGNNPVYCIAEMYDDTVEAFGNTEPDGYMYDYSDGYPVGIVETHYFTEEEIKAAEETISGTPLENFEYTEDCDFIAVNAYYEGNTVTPYAFDIICTKEQGYFIEVTLTDFTGTYLGSETYKVDEKYNELFDKLTEDFFKYLEYLDN